MTAVTIHQKANEASSPRFLAIAGRHQSAGDTPGEALDSLLMQEGNTIDSSLIFIQRCAPDLYFTRAQHDRMKELLNRRHSLTSHENEELDALINAELDATVSRTNPLLQRIGE